MRKIRFKPKIKKVVFYNARGEIVRFKAKKMADKKRLMIKRI